MAESLPLDEVPGLTPSFEEWDVRRYWEWEEQIARPALEAEGWTVGDFVTLEGDSFGPLIRGVTCWKHGRRVRFWYG